MADQAEIGLRHTPWVLACIGLVLGIAAWVAQSYEAVDRVEFLFGVAIGLVLTAVAVVVGAAAPWARVLAGAFGVLMMFIGALAVGLVAWFGGLTIALVAALVHRGPMKGPPRVVSVVFAALAIAVVVYAASLPSEAKPVTFAFPTPMPEADEDSFEQLLQNRQDVTDGYHRLRDDGFCIVWDLNATTAEIAEMEAAMADLGIVRADVPGCSL